MRLKRRKKFSAVRLSLFSQDSQWENFPQDLEEAPFLRFIGNSFFKAIVIMLVQLFLSSLLAYVLSHMRFKGRETLFWIVLSTYMLPIAATYVPRYLFVARMGLMDSLAGIIVSNLANGFTIFYCDKPFWKFWNSWSMRPVLTALQNGGYCGRWLLHFWKTAWSMHSFSVLSIILTTIYGPSLITNSEENYLISVGLNRFFSSQGPFTATFPLIMAATMAEE